MNRQFSFQPQPRGAGTLESSQLTRAEHWLLLRAALDRRPKMASVEKLLFLSLLRTYTWCGVRRLCSPMYTMYTTLRYAAEYYLADVYTSLPGVDIAS